MTVKTTLRRLPLHRSLSRPILLGGGERKLVMLNYTLIAALVFGAGIHCLTIITALLLATLGQVGLRQLANHDAQMLQVYLRYRTYQKIYPAQSTLTNRIHPVRVAIVKGARP
jgi:type IV secretion system protein VirB3